MNPRKNANAINLFSLFLILLLMAGWAGSPFPAAASASAEVRFEDVAVFYQFGDQATFQARVEAPSPIVEVVLLIQSAPYPPINQALTLEEGNQVVFQLDLQKNDIRPFSLVDYWFKGRLKNGSTFESDHYSFDYIDNRFEWQFGSDSRFQVFWNSAALALGDTVLQVALEGLRSAVTLLPVSPPLPIRIFVYDSGEEMHEALQLGRLSWVAGHTDPDINVILISLPPALEQRLELERILPHELMHILQYQVTGDQNQDTPLWLREGLSSLAEIYSNPDYARSLDQAIQNDSLLPMVSLCESFPNEASLALQAYAQSTSFVGYLVDRFGISTIQSLLKNYADGMSCESGILSVYGSDLNLLESQWKQEELGLDMGRLAWRGLSPYLFLAVLLLVPPLVVIGFQRRKKSHPTPMDGD